MAIAPEGGGPIIEPIIIPVSEGGPIIEPIIEPMPLIEASTRLTPRPSLPPTPHRAHHTNTMRSTSSAALLLTLAPAGAILMSAPRKSEALPWLDAPTEPWYGEMAGDCGFDPLGLAASPALLTYYREAELKHARLAMLAAIGWPASELWDDGLSGLVGADPLLTPLGGG